MTPISSIFVLQSEPIAAGLWFGNKAKEPLDLHQRWQMRGGGICWEPSIPVNAQYWSERIAALAHQANQRRQTGAFLRLSKTSQTGATWSLPAIAACPLRDETCEHCYALARWYRNDLKRQIDRVLRLEYLQKLIRQGALATWVDWMVTKLKALPADEPWPPALRRQGLPDGFYHGDTVQYFRWHDSGDLFHEQYALAIFRVCSATPRVAHWLPTRMGGLVRTLVRQGAVIPNNLSIQVSVQRGGKLEQAQIQAVGDVLQAQPSVRIGLSYCDTGIVSRDVDVNLVEDQFGRGAAMCPALIAKKPEDRVCAGCRRCWGASVEQPIIYPNCSATPWKATASRPNSTAPVDVLSLARPRRIASCAPHDGSQKCSSALVLARPLPPPRAKKKKKPTLDDLAQLIRQMHVPVVEFGNHAKLAASIAIECAVTCGGYLREAKASKELHGRFTTWVRRQCGIEPRTARNYMRLHIWVCSHQSEILKAKPHSLRQFYILAGILPEDESKKLPKESNDELAKLRRLVRRVTAEAAAHRDYADIERLWKALEPLAALLREVSTDIGEKRKHVSAQAG